MRFHSQVRMHRTGFAGLVALCCAAQAGAATNVAYTLEVGGDNHAAAYHAGSKQFFTPGSTADGQIFGSGGLVTWGVRIALTGTHAGVTIPGNQYAPNGVANFVFDLELHSGSVGGPLVTTAQFQSTIMNGTAPDNLTASAAFALAFNVNTLGPGRVVDTLLNGGALCGGVDNSLDKLKSATYPTNEVQTLGKLVGMGAGYNAWKACCGTAQTTPGIGLNGVLPNAGGLSGLGTNTVVCEGQIGNLTLGTYVLKITPAAGNNVLRGDVNLATDQNSFAVAADTTTGDTITFTIGNPLAGLAINPDPSSPGYIDIPGPITLSWTAGANAVSHDVYFGTTNPPPLIGNQAGTSYNAGVLAPLQTYYWRINERNIDNNVTVGTVWSFDVYTPALATQWKSVRTHGPAGDQSIVLNPAGSSGAAVSTEARQGGVRKLQVDFDQPVVLFSAPGITGSDSNAYPPTSTSLTNGDTRLEINFASGLPDQLCYTINLAGRVYDRDGNGVPMAGDSDCVVRNLYGDANPTSGGIVSLSDAIAVQARAGTAVSLSPWADLDESGTIDNADALAAKAQLGHTVCP